MIRMPLIELNALWQAVQPIDMAAQLFMSFAPGGGKPWEFRSPNQGKHYS